MPTTYDNGEIVAETVYPVGGYKKFPVTAQGVTPSTVANGYAAGTQSTEMADPAGEKKYYVMRGRDSNAAGVVYRSWTVVSQPDYGATFYTGPYSGGSLNLTDVTVIGTWQK